MGTLLLNVFPSTIATQPHDKFALHEDQGSGSELAKEIAPCFQLSVNIFLCEVQIHDAIISLPQYTT